MQIAGYNTISGKIYNNTVAFNGKGGILLWMKMDRVEVKNNIMYKNNEYGFGTWAATGTATVSNNVYHGNALDKAILKSSISLDEGVDIDLPMQTHQRRFESSLLIFHQKNKRYQIQQMLE